VILEEEKSKEVELLRSELRIVIEKLSREKSLINDLLVERDKTLAEYRFNENFILGNRMTIHRSPSFDSVLHQLSEVFGSDKGGDPLKPHPYPHKTHNYVDAYEILFSTLGIPVVNFLECGIGTNNTLIESNMGVGGKPGASLRLWSEFFPSAMIYGVDIDDSILFQEAKIKTFQMDQTSELSIKNFLREVNFLKFDVIIDDGLHSFQANKTLFDNLNFYLRPGGIYVIEDIAFQEIFRYKELFQSPEFDYEIITLEREDTDLGDNNLIVFKKRL